MSESARVRWLIILILAAIDAWGLPHFAMRLDPAGLWRGAAAVAVFAAVAALYTYRRPDERVVDLAHSGAQLITFFAVGAVLSYVVTATALPLIDDRLTAIDRTLGFDWVAWFRWTRQSRIFTAALKLAYMSAMAQLVATTIYLALTGQDRRNAEFLWSIMLSLLAIIPLSGLWPSAGAFWRYDLLPTVDAPFVAEFFAVRSGALHHLDLTKLQGLINFPSFHTSLAVLFVLAWRRHRPLFIAAATLNLLMVLAVPSEGGHYLVDVIAGALVALGAAWAAARIEGRLRRRDDLERQLSPAPSPGGG